MTTNNELDNRRILLVDDTPSIHEDFKKILVRAEEAPKELDDAMAALFGGATPSAPSAAAAPPPRAEKVTFEITSAFQGQEALEKVQQSIRDEKPFAMAFVDIRMPPGWDGVKAIEEIWKIDQELQVAICTAYSDYSWDDTIARLGQSDRLLILKKPFDAVEICQLATALTEKWNLRRRERLAAEKLRLAEQQARAYASSLETINSTLITAKAASDKATELKTDFLLHLSEEVNSGLHSILGETYQLKSLAAGNAGELTNVQTIAALSERLIRTFNKTLDMTRIEAHRLSIHLAPCDVGAAVRQVFESHRAFAVQKGLQYSLQIAEQIPADLHIDEARLRQIVYEIIENAIYYTSSGSVHVRVALDATENWQRPTLRIEVQDSGPGMGNSMDGSAFEPFMNKGTTESGGTGRPGVGLALAKQLAQLMGGDITFDSSPGKGTVFIITLEARTEATVN